MVNMLWAARRMSACHARPRVPGMRAKPGTTQTHAKHGMVNVPRAAQGMGACRAGLRVLGTQDEPSMTWTGAKYDTDPCQA